MKRTTKNIVKAFKNIKRKANSYDRPADTRNHVANKIKQWKSKIGKEETKRNIVDEYGPGIKRRPYKPRS